ncbi:MAG: uL30 family ribosomal protein [Candidatus Micrarchaeaceae archaeon]
MNNIKGNLIAVVRIRGRVKVRRDIQETLDRLHLKKPNNCIIIKATEAYMGMIKKANDYIAYGEVDEGVLEKLIKKYKINAQPADFSEASKVKEIKEHFPIRLRPPRRGHREIKKGYAEHGALGYRGKDINNLIRRMM